MTMPRDNDQDLPDPIRRARLDLRDMERQLTQLESNIESTESERRALRSAIVELKGVIEFHTRSRPERRCREPNCRIDR
jgi:hypothetical protein